MVEQKIHNGRTKINFYPFCSAENIFIEHFNDDRLLNKRKKILVDVDIKLNCC